MILARRLSIGALAALIAGTSLAAQADAPGAPTNLAVAVSGTSIVITCQPGAGAAPTSYELEAALTPGGPAVGSVPVTPPTLTVHNVPAGRM